MLIRRLIAIKTISATGKWSRRDPKQLDGIQEVELANDTISPSFYGREQT